MTSLKTQLLVHLIVLWTLLLEFYEKSRYAITDLFYYLKDYYHGYHDTWLFIHGHSLPISLNHFYNNNHVTWIYHNSSTTLEHSSDDNRKKYYKMSWLSANIHIHESNIIEYNMDSFLESFLVKTSSNHLPTLSTIFNAWCAHTKHWFRPHSTIEFHIINHLGEDQIINLNNNVLECKNDKLYVSF